VGGFPDIICARIEFPRVLTVFGIYWADVGASGGTT